MLGLVHVPALVFALVVHVLEVLQRLHCLHVLLALQHACSEPVLMSYSVSIMALYVWPVLAVVVEPLPDHAYDL